MVQLRKPVFVVGLHRTGSTWLKNALDRSSGLAMVTDEMHLDGPWRPGLVSQLARIPRVDSEDGLEQIMLLLLSGRLYGRFWQDLRDLEIDRDQLRSRIGASDRSAQSIVSILLDAYRETRGRQRVGGKYPLHISRAALLRHWFPDCKIVHLTRDPRAIVCSKLNDQATQRRIAAAGVLGFAVHYFTMAVFLTDYVWSAWIHHRLEPDAGYMLVRYEELVAAPQQTLSDVCRFAEIEFTDKMLDATGKPSSHVATAVAGINGSSLTRWKTVLGGFDRNLITLLSAFARRRLNRRSVPASTEEKRCQASY